jgi:hypothetical protein
MLCALTERSTVCLSNMVLQHLNRRGNSVRDTRLPTVRAYLTRARSRWQLGAMLRGAVWSLLLALVVLCALEATAAFLDGLPAARWLSVASGHPGANPLALSALVFGGALAVAVLWILLRAPSLADLARMADRKCALRERLSTALEVDGNLQSTLGSDLVRAALLADAERHAGAVDPRGLFSLSLPRAAWLVPALLVIAILLQVVPPDAFSRAAPVASPARDAADAGTLSGQQAADMAANLRRIAEILDQDAAQRSDPYLRTIARALERLSTEVARTTPDRRQLAGELDRLLAHTQQAYADNARPASQTSPRQAPADLLRSTLNELTRNRQTDTVAERDADPAPSQAAATERAPPVRPVQPPQERRPTGIRTPSDQIAAARRMLGADLPWVFLDEDGAEVDPRSQIERLMADEERRARAAAQPAGAAANAGQGEGDRAGDGVQPLGRGNAKNTDLAATEQMLLPDPERRDGGRIRIEIPSDAQRSDVAAPTSDPSGGWRRAQEQPVERPSLAAEGRRVVGRYFKRVESREPMGQGPQGRTP